MNPRMKLLPLMLLAITHGAIAQQLPGAGSQLRQLPTPPPPQQAQPQVRIEESAAPAAAGADAPTVLVNRLQVTGATVFPASELVAIAQFTPGSQLTLAQLQAMAARITQHYRSNGYFVARAYLPAQDVSSNTVNIAVSEGVLGEVTLRNQSNLADDVARSRLAGLESGDPITLDPIENRLLLLSDIPGVIVQSTMVPGQAPGSSDLVVDINDGRRISGSVDADNAGNPYTGEYRVGATVNLNTNLYAGLAYEHRTFEDRIDLISSVTDKQANVVIASLYGNHYDSFGSGGANAFYLGLSSGDLDIQTPAARAADAATARTQGSYTKLAFNASRLQRVTDLVSVYGAIGGQVASGNLDASEKMVLGGMDGVRAYPQGEGFGDEGLLATVEARLLLAGLSERVPGQVHLLGFVDGGRLTVDKDPWFAGDNTRTLSSTGVGLTWDEPGNFAVRTYYAVKLGSEEAISAPDKSGRFWIQAIKYF